MNELQVVRDRRLLDFVSDALDVGDPEVVCVACPHCGLGVRFPKAVSEGDLNRIRSVIGMVERYAADKGITEKMLAEVLSQCVIALAKQPHGKGGA